mgnify:CR=1 FL=1
MTELKVDAIVNLAGSGKPNLPVAPTVGSNAAISTLNTHSYTSSGTEPSSPKNGALWWDSANDKVKVYIDSEFKEVELNSSAASNAWSGDRAVIIGNGVGTGQDQIQRFDITTAGNSVDFGDLLNRPVIARASGSSTRVIIGGGYDHASSARTNVLQYVTPSSPGNATDFGDLTQARNATGSSSNGTRALWFSGYAQSGGKVNTVDYVTVASTGNATDFGDTVNSENSKGTSGSVGDATRALFANSEDNTRQAIDYFTYASAGNGTDFGDLIQAGAQVAGCSDATRSVFSGGRNGNSSSHTDMIQYVTTQTTGNATDFGNLTWNSSEQPGGIANATRGVTFGGGNEGTLTTNMDFYTIQTAANAADFADLLNTLEFANGSSGAAA